MRTSCRMSRRLAVVVPAAILEACAGDTCRCKSDGDVLRDFDAVDATDDERYEPDWNIAPTKPVRTIVNRPLRDAEGTPAATPTRQLRVMSWGLVPSWAKDRKTQGRMFNARVESVTDKPAFRTAYAKRRCLIPADGWYEWRTVDGPDGPVKQPMLHDPARRPLDRVRRPVRVLARRRRPDAVDVHDHHHGRRSARWPTIHDRMPLVLPRDGLGALARSRGRPTRPICCAAGTKRRASTSSCARSRRR